MEEIMQEKISADHLLYVSLKYTKTCDVMINLLLRWKKMIETSINEILIQAQKNKKISSVSSSPMEKIDQVRKLFKKNKDFLEVIDLYEMFRKLNELKKERVGEFRKNVALKISYRGEIIVVNLEQLKIYAEMLEKFISTTSDFLKHKKK